MCNIVTLACLASFYSGVIKNGGAQPNIIPEETELEYYLRTPTDTEMSVLKEKVKACIEAAALATGCKVIQPCHTAVTCMYGK